MLALPVALTLLASSMRLYPFHGRLVLFLAPVFLIAIASGLDRVREVRALRTVYFGLVLMVIAVPAAITCDQLIELRPSHNYLGDLHPDDSDPYRFPF